MMQKNKHSVEIETEYLQIGIVNNVLLIFNFMGDNLNDN
ncbi:hypothetical protein CIN_20680 [Commensalibacter intestini A911]|uniref:Uncharacterized protein n=1 Tax=Commensalibacter intestini A911 TaxID=1088868 RepID=G6F372_9PROT|nr:hypothetical protein CIN_20680 [Commensalibacter intestini A911]